MSQQHASRRAFLSVLLSAVAGLEVGLGAKAQAQQRGTAQTPASRIRIPETLGPSLARLRIEKTNYEDLLWPGASFRALKAKQLHFVDCLMHQCDFGRAQFDEVTFERCTLSSCDFANASLRGCTFRDCEIRGLGGNESILVGTSFHNTSLRGASFDHATIRELRFDGGRFEGILVSECTLGALSFIGAVLSEVRMRHGPIGVMSINECAVSELSIADSQLDSLLVRAGSLMSVAISSSSVGELVLEDQTRITGLRLLSVDAKHAALLRPRQAAAFYFHQTGFGLLELRDGTFEGHIQNCSLGAGSRIERAKLTFLSLDQSKLKGVTIEDVELVDSLLARDTHFSHLKLVKVRYAATVEIVTDGAVFANSDRFQGK